MSFLLPSAGSSSRAIFSRSVPLTAVGSQRFKADKKKSAAPVKTGGKKPPPVDTSGDSATDLLKKDLYPPGSVSESPSSIPRLDRIQNILHLSPTPEVHDTITRAALLDRLTNTERQVQSLRAKHAAMFNACEELRVSYPSFYELASEENKPSGQAGPAENKDIKNLLNGVEQGKGKVEGLFPREMRVFTETPGKDGWDYEWKWVPEEKAKEKVQFEPTQ
ncbi:hypothetical protein [Phaffia rhodozyma]|uniref:Uncharacterized protein n=1 Tax=Phaffia rhodozyma TaxID=264483 RepID=A0A0F7SGD1_PHARH|nr:hypothetical protein [Phaffia rhodozyma]